MKYLKIFEARSVEDYQKALKSIKNMVSSDKPKEDVVAFINKFYSDTAKDIDKLRIILDRIAKELYYKKDHIYYKKRPKVKKYIDQDGVKHEYNEYDKKEFYTIKKDEQSSLLIWANKEKAKYDKIISLVDCNNIDSIISIFERLFDLLYWVIETGPIKSEILSDLNNTPFDNLQTNGYVRGGCHDAISKINNLNNLDFENEVEEVTNLVRIGKIQIKRAMNE